jgi:single-strand DNA-binding protein
MAGETTITVVGNLVNDPEMRYTNSGAGVATFRIASTPRTLDRQSGEWKDGEALFLTCNIWREAAEHVVQSLQRGARVIVQGRLRQRSYETKEGEKRSVYELEVDEIGPSLRYATATVQKAVRSGGGGGFGNSGGGYGSGGGGNRQSGGNNNSGGGGRGNSNDFDDPWSTAAPASGGRSGGGGGNSSFGDDEPPF